VSDSWVKRAACRGKPEHFFPTDGRPSAEARAICAACPVTVECLADDSPDDRSVRAGLGSRERQIGGEYARFICRTCSEPFWRLPRQTGERVTCSSECSERWWADRPRRLSETG
jgi:hypothetical protein